MGYNYFHPTHRAARSKAFERSDGLCQSCGLREATEGHHWAISYPKEEDMTANDLTALCWICHLIATTIRRFRGDIWEVSAIIQEIIGQCYTTSDLKAFRQSLCTLHLESTPYSHQHRQKGHHFQARRQPD